MKKLLKLIYYLFNTIKVLIINNSGVCCSNRYNEGVQSFKRSYSNRLFYFNYNSLFNSFRFRFLSNTYLFNRRFSNNAILYSSNFSKESNNNNINKNIDNNNIDNQEKSLNIGNININSDYGFFIREGIFGNLDQNNKFIKAFKDFFIKESKIIQFQKNSKGIGSYREALYVIGSFDVVMNTQLFIDRLQEFLNEIPEGIVVSILPQIFSSNKFTTVCDSMHVLNNTDSKDTGEYLHSKMIESIYKYEELGGLEIINNHDLYYENPELYDSDLRIVLSYKIWLDNDDYKHLTEEVIKQKLNKIKNVIDKDLNLKLRKMAQNSKNDKLFGINKKSNLLDMINNMLSIYNYLEINKDFYGILNNYSNVKFNNLKVYNIYDIMDIKFNNYCIVELVQDVYNEKIYILVDKKSIVDDLNLFMSNSIKYHRLA
jgi:hypothetical protein